MDAKVRDNAIEIACSYMVMARQIEPRAIPHYLSMAAKLSDTEVAQIVRGSQIIYKRYLETKLPMN